VGSRCAATLPGGSGGDVHPGGIDHQATAEQIEHIAALIPDEWLEPSATGSAQQCVDRVRKEFDYCADAVIMHGATPEELAPIVAVYRNTVV
jgi:hypothetical protein